MASRWQASAFRVAGPPWGCDVADFDAVLGVGPDVAQQMRVADVVNHGTIYLSDAASMHGQPSAAGKLGTP